MRDILIKLLIWLITTLSNIFVVPVVTFLTGLMPDLSVALSTASTFISSYVIPYLKFAKAVFMNCTGCSQTILSIVISYISFLILLHAGMKVYKLIIKIWTLVKP